MADAERLAYAVLHNKERRPIRSLCRTIFMALTRWQPPSAQETQDGAAPELTLRTARVIP